MKTFVANIPPTGLCPVPAGGLTDPQLIFPRFTLCARGVPKLNSGHATVNICETKNCGIKVCELDLKK